MNHMTEHTILVDSDHSVEVVHYYINHSTNRAFLRKGGTDSRKEALLRLHLDDLGKSDIPLLLTRRTK